MKSTLLKFFLILTSVLLFGVNASAQGTTVLGNEGFPTGESSDPIKFFFSVTGFSELGGLGAQSTVYATVFDGNQDYNFEVVLPNKNNIVCSDQATVRAMMHNVASLNVDANETRTHEVTINTQTSVSTQKLGDWLPKTYSFQGATLPITVVDYNHGETIKKEFTYTLSGASHGENGWRITGVRNNFQDAHDAWYLITKGPAGITKEHVTADRKGDEDSFLYLPAGAYVQMHNGRVTATSSVSMSEGTFNLAALRQMFSNVETVANPEEKAIFYLPAGTKLTIGASYATLNEPAWITVDLTKMPQSKTLKDVLSNLKTASKDNSSFIQAFLQMFDGLVEAVDLAGEVPIEVRFGEPAFIQVFEGKSTPERELKTPTQFAEILKTYPNAVGYVWSNLNGTNYSTPENIAIADKSGVQNIVIDYPVGKKGHYYECNNLVLIDDATKNATHDYYSPEDFVALNLNFSRNNISGLRTACLPFSVSSEDIGGKLYVFSQEDVASSVGTEHQFYFALKDEVEPGIACMTYCPGGTSWNLSYNTPKRIVANPVKATNMQGVFQLSIIGLGHYLLNANNEYGPTSASSGLTVFRSYLDVDDKDPAHGNPGGNTTSKSFSIRLEGEDVTSLMPVPTENNVISEVYNVNGSRINSLQKGVNIAKFADGSIRKVVVR